MIFIVIYGAVFIFAGFALGIYNYIRDYKKQRVAALQALQARQRGTAYIMKRRLEPLTADEIEELETIELQIAATTRLLYETKKRWNAETDDYKKAQLYSKYANLRGRVDSLNKKRIKLESRKH